MCIRDREQTQLVFSVNRARGSAKSQNLIKPIENEWEFEHYHEKCFETPRKPLLKQCFLFAKSPSRNHCYSLGKSIICGSAESHWKYLIKPVESDSFLGPIAEKAKKIIGKALGKQGLAKPEMHLRKTFQTLSKNRVWRISKMLCKIPYKTCWILSLLEANCEKRP